jgi:diadenosine tetraphosphate (Ap4A) HIT family hydrolase
MSTVIARSEATWRSRATTAAVQTLGSHDLALNPLLEKDTLAVGDLPLSRVLLINDARWPWLILVPRRAGAVELTDLDVADRALLIEEAASAAAFLKAHARADKINVATLGNVIRQFHLHVVARMVGDPAWPGPVWGHGTARPYERSQAGALIEKARTALDL